MINIPAPAHGREEWADADFDLPEGDVVIPAPDDSDKDDEDWDTEMNLGKTGGAKAVPLKQAISPWVPSTSSPSKRMLKIRPPPENTSGPLSIDGDDDDEGVSTIKVSALPALQTKKTEARPVVIADEDMECDFALPTELTQLSLKPLSLNHRLSKCSLEWGDRDHTSSSASSSDAYSSLGFGPAASPSTNSTSASLPGTDDDMDGEDEGDLDGLVIPTGLFESDQGRKHLTKILDMKKKMPKVEEHIKITTPDPEDDFEIGLVINGDDDLNPKKLQQSKREGTLSTRSYSMPARPPSSLRPPSRVQTTRPKTPVSRAGSSSQGSSRGSISPPQRPPQSRRALTLQNIPPPPPIPSNVPSSFLASKPGPLRNQKSHGVLKSPSPPNSASRKLSRKASLSSLMEMSNVQASGSSQASSSKPPHSYSAATVASRARTHTNSTSRMQAIDGSVPPTRPSTPSANPAALRLTMPTSISRMKSRPTLAGLFPGSNTPSPALTPTPTPSSSTNHSPAQSTNNTRSPPTLAGLGRPPSSLSTVTGSTRILRKAKRRVFGDGTELDGIEDLPTDRDKEARYRVQPKGSQNRVPGATYQKSEKSDKDSGKGTIRRKKDNTSTESALQPSTVTNSLKHKQSRHDSLSKSEHPNKKKPLNSSVSNVTRRKPTLIRNLGGTSAPKVVGEMRWNPQTLRWEGNDHVLREFDAVVGTSIRPALITHLTGSSIGSPVGNFGSAARVVGNMVFDPSRMCWMSTLPPEEDEPDVFADLADDEEDGWETKGGTIRAAQQISRTTASTSSALSDASGRISDASRMRSPSPAPSSHVRSHSESESERGSRASIVFDVDDNFVEICRNAEARHRTEMKGWAVGSTDFTSDNDRPYLYEIRALATRPY